MNNFTEVLGTVAMVPKGEYDSSAYYEYLNVVEYEGSSYMAKQAVNNVLPTNEEFWQYLGGGVKRTDTAIVFDTVADMKSSEILKDGMTVQTLGYYSVNDGGSATYKITDTESQTEYQEEVGDLYATLIIDNIANVKQFGAYGDGTHDDTDKIQKCLDLYKNILIENGIYLIDAIKHVNPKSNTKINLINATLKAITTNIANYSIVNINDVNNLIIEGGIIEGERLTHQGTTGEWGMGISIINSSNIILKNILIKDCWGDGLYISNGNNVSTYNIVVDNVRRNGYSIISANGFNSNNDIIKNTNGTAPQSGIDFEPNNVNEYFKNCVINNLTTLNNAGTGIDIVLTKGDGTTSSFDITINNHKDDSSNNGLSIAKNEYSKGYININKSLYLNSKANGINLRACRYSDCQININKPIIKNYNTTNTANQLYSNGIALFLDVNETLSDLGNIHIINPYIETSSDNGRYILTKTGSNDYFIKDFSIIGPLNRNKTLFLQNVDILEFKDDYEKFVWSANANDSLGSSNIRSLYNDKAFTRNITLTIGNSFLINQEVTFIKTTTDYQMNIVLPADTYCHALSSNANPTIRLTSIGQLLKLKRVSETEFIVLNQIGTPTIV